MPTRTQKKTANEPRASRPNMPDYGIADAESGEGLLPWSWATEKLTKTQNYFLCTTRSDGRPHVMPIWGVWMDDAFYFSTGKSSVKARNLEGNPHCVLCPGDADESVIVEGAATKTANKDVLKEFAVAYRKKYKFDPLSMKQPIFVMKPEVAFGQIEKTYTKSATRWRFNRSSSER